MGFLLVLCAALVLTANAEKATFHGHKVRRLTPTTEEQFIALKNLKNYVDGCSSWKESRGIGHPADIMVPPYKAADFEKFVTQYNIKDETFIKDVQELIDKERPLKSYRTGFGWNDYYPLEEIYAWLDTLVNKYPGVVTSIIGGETYEGRKIKGVKVSFKPGNPGVFIEGGIHAREWITPATVTYILNKLLTTNDTSIKDVVRSYDYYVFPSVNPDGYVYTHTTNRLWRKTRSRSNNGCYGADPNRNWDFHWMENSGASSDPCSDTYAEGSSDPCSDTYAGSSAFSEIETKTLSQYIDSIQDKFDVYLAFHNFGQLLMFPYGHSNEHVSNYDELMSIAKEAVAALAKNNGTKYKYGSTFDTIYPASGTSMDWVRGVYNKNYTFTWELRDKGRFAFLLPGNQIIDTAEETFNSVLVILQEAKRIL